MKIIILKFCIVILIVFFGFKSSAASIEVIKNIDDNSSGTLRYAVMNAMDGDTITFATITNGSPIILNGEIIISKNITIIGNEPTNTIIDGNQSGRIFNIPGFNTIVTFVGITIQNGKVIGRAVNGGGIYNNGILTINNTAILDNSADAYTGAGAGSLFGALAGAQGGGIYNNRVLNINNSIISRNKAEPDVKADPGITASTIAQGGGIYNTGNLTIKKTLISENIADSDSEAEVVAIAFAQGGGIYNNGLLEISNSTISGNFSNTEAEVDAGPDAYSWVDSGGAGIYNSSNSNRRNLIINNTSISGNSANAGADVDASYTDAISQGGGIYHRLSGNLTMNGSIIYGNSTIADGIISRRTIAQGGGIYLDSSGKIKINNCTISGNSTQADATQNEAAVAEGGGIYNGNLTINNSIIALNSAEGDGPDILKRRFSPINLIGQNIIGNNKGSDIAAKDGFIGDSENPIDPLFIENVPASPSSDGNLRLQCVSPGINTGNNSTVPYQLTTDLDGEPRVVFEFVDIGAYEFQTSDADGTACLQMLGIPSMGQWTLFIFGLLLLSAGLVFINQLMMAEKADQ